MRTQSRKGLSHFLMTFLLTVWILIICFFPAPSTWAEETPGIDAEAEDPLLTAELSLQRRKIRDLQLSPDEKRIAMVITEPTRGDTQNSNIWVYEVDTRKTQRLTTSKKLDSHPRWSPDGKTLAFLSNRTGSQNIYLLPIQGGESFPLTEEKPGIRTFEWSPDGSKIGFISSDPKTEEEQKRVKEKDDPVVWDQNIKDPRLRTIDLKSREIKTLTQESLRVIQMTWLPDGERLLIAATDHPNRDFFTYRLFLIHSNTKKQQEIEAPPGQYRQLKISPDGKQLAFVGSRTPEHGPIVIDLYLRPLQGGKTQNLTAAAIDRQIKSFVWKNDGSFVVLAKTGFTSSFLTVSPDGKTIKRVEAYEINPLDDFVIGDGFMAFVGDRATQPTELWISKSPGQAEKVTSFNKSLESVWLAEPEVFQYPSFDGLKIEAALLKPKDYRPGTRIPLVAIIHGGPTARFADRFLYRLSSVWAQLLAAQGYAVLIPNIRGSTGYGLEFASLCRYDWGGGDWKDVLAGVDYLIEKGIADPDRLGIGGWSYGGYMAAWAVTQTDRFKIAVAGSPMTDMAVEYGTENHGTNIYDDWFLGNPYENLELFNRMSPIAYVKNAKTPILILMGENDPINPIAQCFMYYRGLMRYGVTTEFVYYPREPHGLREEKHVLDMIHRMLDWFSRYLD